MTQLSGLLSILGRGREMQMTSYPERPRDPNNEPNPLIFRFTFSFQTNDQPQSRTID